MIIKEYKYDDEELIYVLRHHFGSDLHFREHKKHFHRAPDKIFYVGFMGDSVVCYCSVKKGEIQDITTLPLFRGQGFATQLIKHIQSKNAILTLGTSNEAMKKVAVKCGFIYRLNRGIYAYYRWENENVH